MDCQTVMAVQSLLESQNLQESLPADDDPDMFQCGKCKQGFVNLGSFLAHKQQGPCAIVGNGNGGLRQGQQQSPAGNSRNIGNIGSIAGGHLVSLPAGMHCHASSANTSSGGVIYTAQLQHPLNKQSNAYVVPLPLQSFSQGMVLSDDMITFQTVDSSTAVQLQPIHCGRNPFLSPPSTSISCSDVAKHDMHPLQQQQQHASYCTYLPQSSYTVDENGCILQTSSLPEAATQEQMAHDSAELLSQLDMKRVTMNASCGQLDLREIVMNVPSSSQCFSVDVGSLMMPSVDSDAAAVNATRATHAESGLLGHSSPVDPTALKMAAANPSYNVTRKRIVKSLHAPSPGAAGGGADTPTSAACSALPSARRCRLKCDYCDKVFAKNFDLQQHTRSHTGERPFQCIVCGRAFAQKSNVKKHLQTHKVWPKGMSKTLPEPMIVELQQQNSCPPVTDGPAAVVVESTNVPESSVSNTVAAAAASSPGDIPADGNQMTTLNQLIGKKGLQLIINGEHSDLPVQTVMQLKCVLADNDGTNESTVVIDNSYLCQYCNSKFSTYHHLKSHMVIHKDEQVYKCVLRSCGESFRDVESFLDHIKFHENQLSYRCHVCNKQFTTLQDLAQHQYTHSLYPNHGPKAGPKFFRCTQCNSKYATPESLQHHLETTSHSYNCPHCAKVFTCERYLRRHLLIHGGDFECTICGKHFQAEQYLKVHMVTHGDQKPFCCDICQASFKRKDRLKRHLLIHAPTKLYKCPLRASTGCTKEFNRSDKLKAHLLSHTGAKPFRCRTCARTFTRQQHLREHERVHANDYRFWCSACGHGFLRQKLLGAHRCSAAASAPKVQPAADSAVTTTGVVPNGSKLVRRKVGRPRKSLTVDTAAEISSRAQDNSDATAEVAAATEDTKPAMLPRRGRPAKRRFQKSKPKETTNVQPDFVVVNGSTPNASISASDNVTYSARPLVGSIGQLKNGLMYIIQPVITGIPNDPDDPNTGYTSTLVVTPEPDPSRCGTSSSAAMLIGDANVISGANSLASLLTAAGISNAVGSSNGGDAAVQPAK